MLFVMWVVCVVECVVFVGWQAALAAAFSAIPEFGYFFSSRLFRSCALCFLFPIVGNYLLAVLILFLTFKSPTISALAVRSSTCCRGSAGPITNAYYTIHASQPTVFIVVDYWFVRVHEFGAGISRFVVRGSIVFDRTHAEFPLLDLRIVPLIYEY